MEKGGTKRDGRGKYGGGVEGKKKSESGRRKRDKARARKREKTDGRKHWWVGGKARENYRENGCQYLYM